jgi:hypothetical protein
VAPPATTAPVAETAEQRAAREKAESDAAAAAEQKLFGDLEAYYKLPEAEAAALQTEPEVALPKLAARLHLAVARGVQQMLATQLPSMVHGVQEVYRRNEAAKASFYGAWPMLNEREHGAAVLQAAQLFRQLNPNATAEEAVQRIGKVVCESLGIAIPSAGGAAPGGTAAPAQALGSKPAPFVPAGGATGARVTAHTFDNEFEAMANEMLNSND